MGWFSRKRDDSIEHLLNHLIARIDNLQTQIGRLIQQQEKNMAIEKEEVRQLLGIVSRLLSTNVEDKAQIQALQAEAANLRSQVEWVNDPELDAELEGVLAAAAAAAPARTIPTAPGEPVNPTVQEQPVVTGGPAAERETRVPTQDPAPQVTEPTQQVVDPNAASQNQAVPSESVSPQTNVADPRTGPGIQTTVSDQPAGQNNMPENNNPQQS